MEKKNDTRKTEKEWSLGSKDSQTLKVLYYPQPHHRGNGRETTVKLCDVLEIRGASGEIKAIREREINS